MKISLKEIELLFALVTKKLKDDELYEIELDVDNYLFISSDQWESFQNYPEPIVGSLIDDIESLKSGCLSDDIITYVDFDRISFLLRAISQQMNPI